MCSDVYGNKSDEHKMSEPNNSDPAVYVTQAPPCVSVHEISHRVYPKPFKYFHALIAGFR